MEAAETPRLQVIIQASRGARNHTDDAHTRHFMLAAAGLHPRILVAMRQDEGASPEAC